MRGPMILDEVAGWGHPLSAEQKARFAGARGHHAEPMDADRRRDIYRAQTGRRCLTPRQFRRWAKKLDRVPF